MANPKICKPYLNMNKLVSDALGKYVNDVSQKITLKEFLRYWGRGMGYSYGGSSFQNGSRHHIGSAEI